MTLPAAILIRHAEVKENRAGQKVMKGTRDYPVDETGKRESKALAVRIARFRPTVVLSSPLKRALHPAKAIARKAGVALHVLPELAPQDFGNWTGKPAATYEPKLKKMFLEHPDQAPLGGESGTHFVAAHIDPMYRQIKMMIAAGERPAVVSHSRNLRQMDYGLHGGPLADPTKGGPKPSGYAIVDRNLKVKLHSAPVVS